MEKATLVILAGGKSSRFGKDKSQMRINGRPLIEINVEKSRPVFDEILISSNAESKFGIPGIRELSDTYIGMGPLAGILSGLSESRNEAVFFAACDMPFFNIDLAKEILSALEGHDICVPVNGEKTEPLFGVYRKTLIPVITELLDNDMRSMRCLLDRADTFYFDCADWLSEHGAENAFYNVNYQQDFEKIQGCVEK